MVEDPGAEAWGVIQRCREFEGGDTDRTTGKLLAVRPGSRGLNG